MEKKDHKSLFFYFCAFFLAVLMMGVEEVHCHRRRSGHRRRKLFVFGDSYADTGNLGNLGSSWTSSWYEPYGITFPNRRPTGRFSDGRVLTDYVAGVLGNKSPIPYKFRRYGGNDKPYGMNFAVAGSGVLDTGYFQRELSAQIDTFQAQIDEGVFSENDVKSGVALVVISGNDYLHFLHTGRGMGEVVSLVVNVSNKLEVELERIHKQIGVGKVVVTNLHPVGCTPKLTRPNNYAKCNESASMLESLHNHLLLRVVDRLQKRITATTPAANYTSYHILDLNTAFTSIIHQEKGVRKFKNILRPCCEGKGEENDCAHEESSSSGVRVKQYTLCHDPEQHYYWDSLHPTQAAWAAVFQLIRPWLTRNLITS